MTGWAIALWTPILVYQYATNVKLPGRSYAVAIAFSVVFSADRVY